MTQNPLNTVGRSVPQLEAAEKLGGTGQYIADMVRPGMLHGALLQSPFAHARIRGYDLSEALALPGVHAIVTGDDVDEHHRMGAFVKDEPGLAKGKVRYVGEIVAAVAADTEAIARRATRLIRVDYEELPAVFDPIEALKPGSPAVHEKAHEYETVFDSGTQHNTTSRTELRQGEAETAWAQCAVVVEGVFQTQAQAHLSMEPCGALARWTPVVASPFGRPTSRCSASRPASAKPWACPCRACAASRRSSVPALATRWNRMFSPSPFCWP